MLRQALLTADGFHFLTFEEEWTHGRCDRLAGVLEVCYSQQLVGIHGRRHCPA